MALLAAAHLFDVDGDALHVRLPNKRFGSSVLPAATLPTFYSSDDPYLVISSRQWCLDNRGEAGSTTRAGSPKCPICDIASGLIYSVKLPGWKTSLPASIEAALAMVRRIRAPAGTISVSQLSSAEWMERYQREPSILSEDYRKVLEKFRLPLDSDEFDRLIILHRLSPRSEASLRSSQKVMLNQQIRLLKEDFDEARLVGKIVNRRSSIPILDDLLAIAPRIAPAPFDFLPTQVIECSDHGSADVGKSRRLTWSSVP